MKILLTMSDVFVLGGVTTFCDTLRRYYSKNIEVFIVGKRGKEKGISSNIIRFFEDIIRFKRKIKNSNYDIIHLNPSFKYKSIIRDGLLLACAKNYNKNVIVFFHGWDKSFEKSLNGIRIYLFKKIYFNADAMIVLANEFKNVLINWGYRRSIYTLSTMLDDTLIQDFDLKKKSLKHKEYIDLLFLSRIEREKGIYETIDAYTILKEKYKKLRLNIAGDGLELENVRKYCKQKEIADVLFYGHVSGELKKEVFEKSDIYLLPSYNEGMPISLLEAMGMALPVITRPVGGIKDFFVHGRMGFITESKHSSDIAHYIETLIVNPHLRTRVSRYNRYYALKNFRASKVVDKIISIYNETSEVIN